MSLSSGWTKSKAVLPDDVLASAEAPLSSNMVAMPLCRFVIAHIRALHWFWSCLSTSTPASTRACTTASWPLYRLAMFPWQHLLVLSEGAFDIQSSSHRSRAASPRRRGR